MARGTRIQPAWNGSETTSDRGIPSNSSAIYWRVYTFGDLAARETRRLAGLCRGKAVPCLRVRQLCYAPDSRCSLRFPAYVLLAPEGAELCSRLAHRNGVGMRNHQEIHGFAVGVGDVSWGVDSLERRTHRGKSLPRANAIAVKV